MVKAEIAQHRACNGWSAYSEPDEKLLTGRDGSRHGLTVHLEQPAALSSGVVVIGSVRRMVVRAHDAKHGFGGKEIVCDLAPLFEPDAPEELVFVEQRRSPLQPL